MAAVAELVLAALTADHRGNFGLRADHGISPQLTGSADFWHPTGCLHRPACQRPEFEIGEVQGGLVQRDRAAVAVAVRLAHDPHIGPCQIQSRKAGVPSGNLPREVSRSQAYPTPSTVPRNTRAARPQATRSSGAISAVRIRVCSPIPSYHPTCGDLTPASPPIWPSPEGLRLAQVRLPWPAGPDAPWCAGPRNIAGTCRRLLACLLM